MSDAPSPPQPIAKRLLDWYDTARRDLPWRAPRGAYPPAYHVLVSEAMLQQTQVVTVIPYFHRFLSAVPTLEALARADEQEVLRLWQGLGYYSRARNLRKAAITVLESHAGRIPSDVETLLTLPGIGRYTAGAIASLAYDTRAPILDGNVVRVLSRLDALTADPRTPAAQKQLWRRAEELIPAERAGDFNSAMMELGATVCTPKNPACLICPLRELCGAFEKQLQHQIPPAKKAKPVPLLIRHVRCIRNARGEYLIEQRPSTGRWAGMWQFLTRETDDFSDLLPGSMPSPTPLGTVRHGLTHRQYEFRVAYSDWPTPAHPVAKPPRRWATLQQMHALPFTRPHLKIRASVERLATV
ncbi:MAG: A/G-specific adenine glycosylase [Tepidisphaeraceae bacterium]